jgi:hypothetical protein
VLGPSAKLYSLSALSRASFASAGGDCPGSSGLCPIRSEKMSEQRTLFGGSLEDERGGLGKVNGKKMALQNPFSDDCLNYDYLALTRQLLIKALIFSILPVVSTVKP